jgi:hypothetical protein
MSDITTLVDGDTGVMTTLVSTTDDPMVTAYVTSDEVVVAPVFVGPQGPPGPPGQWDSMTQAEFDVLDPKDEETLYIIIG